MAQADTQGLKPPNALREGVAVLIAFALALTLASVAAATLRGVIEEDLRSGAVGLAFVTTPALFALALWALSGFKRGDTYPALSPCFVTGLLAGTSLFSWIQLVVLVCSVVIGFVDAQRQYDPQRIATTSGWIATVLFAPAAFLAGLFINRATRWGALLAVILAPLTALALSVFMTWRLAPEVFSNLMESNARSPAVTMALGMTPMAGVGLVFALLGMMWSRLWRDRSISRIGRAARRLPPAQREAVLDEIVKIVARDVPAPKPKPAAAPKQAPPQTAS